jgi:hypothetical protein
MASIRIGDLLVKAKVINETQLRAALSEQQRWGGRLGEILVRMDFLTEDMLVKALSKQLNIVNVNLDELAGVAPHVRSRIPIDVARETVALPLYLKDDGRTLVVAMAEPQNLDLVDTLRSVARLRIQPQIGGRQAIARALSRIYGGPPVELDDADGGFRMLDAQGNSVNPAEGGSGGTVPVATRGSGLRPAPGPALERTPGELLEALTEAQLKEVGVLKGIIALLIEKGVFTREEYLAKVRR